MKSLHSPYVATVFCNVTYITFKAISRGVTGLVQWALSSQFNGRRRTRSISPPASIRMPENHTSPTSLRTNSQPPRVRTFRFCLLESLLRLARAIVHKPDRLLRRQRTADDRRGILADRLVDKIFVIGLAANRPPEADRGHRAGADFRIAFGLDRFGRSRLLLDRGPARARDGFPDDRECWRWPQAHDRSGRFDSRCEASGHCVAGERGKTSLPAPSSLPRP